MNQSLDGYVDHMAFGPGATLYGPEELAFSQAQLARRDVLVFGRRTYEHMAAFCPTPAAASHLPAIADGMNRANKIVVSNSLLEASWGPARIISDDVAGAFRALKPGNGPDMTILGSAEIVTFLAAEGLIDALEIMIHPVAIGAGTPLFAGLSRTLDVSLTDYRIFASGTILLTYATHRATS